MKIGIIGTGSIGATLAFKFVQAGHQVKITNTRPFAELADKARELGASPATIQDLVDDVDVVFVSIPLHAIPKLPSDLFKDVPTEVIVVDTSNYYPHMNGQIDALQHGQVESEWVSGHLGRPVIKAFNNLLAWTLAEGGTVTGTPGRLAISIAGDDVNAKKRVSELVNDAGFDVVDTGSLSESWRQQPGTPAYCTELTKTELTYALAGAVPGSGPQARDQIMTQLSQLNKMPTREEIVALNRALSATK